MTVTFVRRLLCCSELYVFNIDTQAVTSGEYVNMSKSDQRDLEGLYKICHNQKIQITQNKNPVEANHIAYHIIVNFYKTDIQLSQKKNAPLMMHFYWHTLYKVQNIFIYFVIDCPHHICFLSISSQVIFSITKQNLNHIPLSIKFLQYFKSFKGCKDTS